MKVQQIFVEIVQLPALQPFRAILNRGCPDRAHICANLYHDVSHELGPLELEAPREKRDDFTIAGILAQIRNALKVKVF